MEGNNDGDVQEIRELIARQFASLSWKQGGAPNLETFKNDFLADASLYPSARPLWPQSIQQFAERMNALVGTNLRSFDEKGEHSAHFWQCRGCSDRLREHREYDRHKPERRDDAIGQGRRMLAYRRAGLGQGDRGQSRDKRGLANRASSNRVIAVIGMEFFFHKQMGLLSL